MTPFWQDPFFWAFLGAIGWAMGMLIVGSPSVGRYMLYGIVASSLMQIPRIILPLPFVEGHFEVSIPVRVVAVLIIVVTLYFSVPGLGLKIYTRPTTAEPLLTSGRFAIVRHPILFANVLWSISWPLFWGSWAGLAVAPGWIVVAYLMSFLEEDRLVETYGDDYREYRKKVPRIIPFVKFL